jgi:uncharacterized protein
MLLDLSRFRAGAEHLDRRYEPAAFSKTEDEFRVIAPIEFTADVRKDASKVRLVGRVKTTLGLDCSRCVEPFEVPIDAAFDVLFLPAEVIGGVGEQGVKDDDLNVSFYKDDVIDLGDVMREQFYLALPMKPLCRPDCLGLCAVCGINRNREICTCQSQWVDPRLDALRKLTNSENR